MSRIAIVAGTATETNQDLAESWRDLGLDARVLSAQRCLHELGPGDTAVGRIDVRRTLDGVDTGMTELAALRRRGVSVLNPPDALLGAHDKLITARRLAAAGVPHPATEHLRRHDRIPRVRLPVVVKPRFGSWGAEIFRCDSSAELRATMLAISYRPWFRAHGALVQALVPPVGHDLRVLVAGGRVVGAERRVCATGEWRTNISLGGTFDGAVAPPRARALALAAAKSISADFIGVDLLPHGDTYVVIEVNGAVDFDEGYSLPGRNVFVDIALCLGLVRAATFARRVCTERRRPAAAAR
jgi:RimK family alpha-L-glutamate ligase